ncbi:gtpase ypt3 [Plasmopara halstedii]|uniref:Gtpase ypt3 n=1 Tax=Plasmopara halstedii TaxID=4781 RepID=A0A0P1AT66_PLAHL|nr:gtpase ypt3 [Plasmopara halstedii]CEG45384.1 gtpase ypt3 [Plasmopara halstedii]|eukprot:XP_024581753.1 gtpase ypt3 [Plasmopara halstedii]
MRHSDISSPTTISSTAAETSESAMNSPRFSSPASSPTAESILKVVLIGDSGVGKSNLVMRFTKNKYMPHSLQTVGFEFATKNIRVGDRRLKAQIWDTAGRERFHSLTAAYYRNAVGAMIVYDITNRSSFEHITGWLAQVHEHSHESLVLVLVGNKCDLAHLPNSREVSTLEAARFAAKYSMEFLETSALDTTNVVDAFKKLIVPVGRLLSPTKPKKIARLPPGWRRVLSRTRPGEHSYENQYTKERISFVPKEPAKPSQQSFRPPPSKNKDGLHSNVTVTRESLRKQHQKAYLTQNQTPQCGVCTNDCTIL